MDYDCKFNGRFFDCYSFASLNAATPQHHSFHKPRCRSLNKRNRSAIYVLAGNCNLLAAFGDHASYQLHIPGFGYSSWLQFRFLLTFRPKLQLGLQTVILFVTAALFKTKQDRLLCG